MTETAFLAQDADIQTIWDADLHAVGCLTCGVAHLVPTDARALRCPSCLAEELEPQSARLRPEAPELTIPFSPSLTPADLSSRFAEWLHGVWPRPQDLGAQRLLSRLNRVYLPMWLVDGEVEGTWRARMGFDYQVESSLERFTEGGGWSSRRVKETRVRWEPRVGRIRRTYENLPVPALELQEEEEVAARLGRYQLDRAVAYTPAAVADAALRVPSLLPEEAWPLGRAALDRCAAADCQRAAGAQHSDEFTLSADYHDLNWTQLLLPFFVSYYEDDNGRVIPVWVNGQTGRISGLRRASLRKAWRATGAVGIVAALGLLVGGLLALLRVNQVGSTLMTLSFFLIILGALPVLWAWFFNQRREHVL